MGLTDGNGVGLRVDVGRTLGTNDGRTEGARVGGRLGYGVLVVGALVMVGCGVGRYVGKSEGTYDGSSVGTGDGA